MHSFDERPVGDAVLKGRKLVEEIRRRGEPINVDLGCGFRKTGNLGIDVNPDRTNADLICRLGFEPIPLDDEIADSVYCRDFLEHIPKAYYSESEKRLRYPIIELINEVWRILKSGGSFTSLTPCYPNPEVHRDPTHLSVWTLESMQYFCGKYPVAKVYGIKTEFELVENRLDGFYLHAVLRKP
jgi:SAM-dependent methyltransferase